LEETKKVQERSPQYFKDLKKYLKWHTELWLPIIEKSPDMASASDLEEGLRAQYDRLKHDLEPAEALLKPFDQVLPLDHGELLVHEEASSEADVRMASPEDETGDEDTFSANIQQTYENDTEKISLGEGSIDPALAWARFESEEYIFMRGSIGSLKEGVGINQRYMFTRKLFEGNPDLMNQALHELDKAESFIDAITLLNERYVAELRWDINSEEVDELLQLVFRKFEDKQ
jgi:hypothetical protein